MLALGVFGQIQAVPSLSYKNKLFANVVLLRNQYYQDKQGLASCMTQLTCGRSAVCWHAPCAKRECLSQPPAWLAECVSRRGDPLLAQLPGLALDTRRAPHHVARELAQSHSRFFSTHDSDIAICFVNVSGRHPTPWKHLWDAGHAHRRTGGIFFEHAELTRRAGIQAMLRVLSFNPQGAISCNDSCCAWATILPTYHPVKTSTSSGRANK